MTCCLPRPTFPRFRSQQGGTISLSDALMRPQTFVRERVTGSLGARAGQAEAYRPRRCRVTPFLHGAASRIRTCDPGLKRPLRYHCAMAARLQRT